MTPKIKCDICGKTFSNLRRTVLHMASVHPVEVDLRVGLIQTRPDDAAQPEPEKGLLERVRDTIDSIAP
ncbi:unnamed protein product [marine sediment metagenome]|uniref:C2H2-type domain-containing protein n=1 Tax=marine sediment metagenome TaxID=412755 RepID=X1QPM6_9ZZZZ